MESPDESEEKGNYQGNVICLEQHCFGLLSPKSINSTTFYSQEHPDLDHKCMVFLVFDVWGQILKYEKSS